MQNRDACWGARIASPAARPDRLLERLVDNRRLEHACAMLGEAGQLQQQLSPAGEWLRDNIYLIEEQIRLAQRHLPKGYSRELPRLTQGASRDFPRVYDISLSAIAHGDGRIDADALSRFVAAYQVESDLRMGELWAIPIMLRLALIENLRRIAARVVVARDERALAGDWAARMIDVVESDPKSLVLVIADMALSDPPMTSSFVAELTRRLQGQSSAMMLPLTWIEQWLDDAGHTTNRCVGRREPSHAANQVR